ncbi:Rv3654c family TadE-like protein [Nonomuraea sp. B5E05]|uniref:Rv3654c family TadE-like protein n=1 Tax=Nonomuraea sp. B5E05 TaxID=3153569 RepID=UPI003261AA67
MGRVTARRPRVRHGHGRHRTTPFSPLSGAVQASDRRRRGVNINNKERGSATLWGVALMGLLMAVATAFATVGSVRVAGHRVSSAADLSALAAAEMALADPEGACLRASAIAARNGVKLARCEIRNEIADVWTSLSISLPIAGTRTLTGRSRAGTATVAPAGPAM